jgi:hypothetical protein
MINDNERLEGLAHKALYREFKSGIIPKDVDLEMTRVHIKRKLADQLKREARRVLRKKAKFSHKLR